MSYLSLQGGERAKFKGLTIGEKYGWIEEVLVKFRYIQAQQFGKGGDKEIYRED